MDMPRGRTTWPTCRLKDHSGSRTLVSAKLQIFFPHWPFETINLQIRIFLVRNRSAADQVRSLPSPAPGGCSRRSGRALHDGEHRDNSQNGERDVTSQLRRTKARGCLAYFIRWRRRPDGDVGFVPPTKRITPCKLAGGRTIGTNSPRDGLPSEGTATTRKDLAQWSTFLASNLHRPASA